MEGKASPWIQENILDKGVENVRFWVRMSPLHLIPFLGMAYTSSIDQEYWVECKIIEDRYKVDDGYKLTLKSIDERFGSNHYYQSDFESLVEAGSIFIKQSDFDHIENFINVEYIGGGFEIVTKGHILVQK